MNNKENKTNLELSAKKNKELREIEVETIDLERLKTSVTELPALLKYASNRGSALIEIEDQGKLKGRSLQAMHEQTKKEFSQIIKQMAPLVEQMENLKKRVYLSELVYMANIPFDPIIGQVYFLYKKKDGSTILSMIAPSEWGRSMPYECFEGKLKLMADHTWEVVEESEQE